MSVNLGGNNSMAIESLADVFCLTVSKQAEWNPNAIAGLIHLDEAIYMGEKNLLLVGRRILS